MNHFRLIQGAAVWAGAVLQLHGEEKTHKQHPGTQCSVSVLYVSGYGLPHFFKNTLSDLFTTSKGNDSLIKLQSVKKQEDVTPKLTSDLSGDM